MDITKIDNLMKLSTYYYLVTIENSEGKFNLSTTGNISMFIKKPANDLQEQMLQQILCSTFLIDVNYFS